MASLISGFLRNAFHTPYRLRSVPEWTRQFPGSFVLNNHCFDLNRCISTTSVLLAEPMKKKKRIDPAVVKAREDRKRRKLEKAIRRLAKHEKTLKPIDELEVPTVIVDEFKQRQRRLPQLPTEVLDERWLLQKEWTRYRTTQHFLENDMIDRMIESQENALDELKKESIELYLAAITIDDNFLPYKANGPTDTPPIKDYESPDGDYIDISKKWEKPKAPKDPKERKMLLKMRLS